MQRIPDLDDAVQDLSEAVGHRLILIDETMRVVGYSIHESETDRGRLSHVLAHSDSWDLPRTTTHAYCVEPVPVLGECLFLRLADRNHRITGYLVLVLGTERVPVDVPDRLVAAGPSLGDLLALRGLRAERELARSRSLTVDLVTGGPERRAAAAEALVSERILSASGRYCPVVLGTDPRTASPRDGERAALAVTVTLRFVAQASTASAAGAPLPDGLGVLLFPRPVVQHRLTRILEQPQVAGVRAGIGPLVGLTDVHRSFERARLAWRASYFAPQDHSTVTDWEQVGLDGTLARLPLETLGVDDLPPPVHRLITAGLSLELLTTLDRYLDRGGDAQQTARVLGIHRSTLYYRLGKIRSAVGDDLSDGRLRRELHTGLRIAQLAGLGPWGGR
ncbi:PucR family transcriptional regulator [Streptomyces endophyticus]|uniref:Helix-turn-helix domain-containing protein n=1 Tax=Streptomyces endophyticus TaxID=714166 RepID=A0ABU6F954_9ACTN|nr:helix-turn-helix domain-containing protein [Streptomyces endophyticus]MEB8340172.1 helix-turn-helix domain-containing protein [Streptomyces endophyticus]